VDGKEGSCKDEAMDIEQLKLGFLCMLSINQKIEMR
jgi:hypothetical protein